MPRAVCFRQYPAKTATCAHDMTERSCPAQVAHHGTLEVRTLVKMDLVVFGSFWAVSQACRGGGANLRVQMSPVTQLPPCPDLDVFCEVKGNQIYQIFMSEVPELSRGPFPCPVQAPMLFMYTPDQLICAPAAAVGEPLRILFQVLDHLSGLDFVVCCCHTHTHTHTHVQWGEGGGGLSSPPFAVWTVWTQNFILR